MVNTCTCLTAGVLVFSILGHMAHLQGATVEDVARSGPGLVFLTYPELVLSLPGSFIWAILFFAMLLVISNYVLLDILFPSNHNINRSLYGHRFWASDPLIERFY